MPAFSDMKCRGRIPLFLHLQYAIKTKSHILRTDAIEFNGRFFTDTGG